MNVLGIDVGGTSVKLGQIDNNGIIVDKKSYDTQKWTQNGGFGTNFIECLENYFDEHQNISHIGIGLPGLLTYDRKAIISLPNIQGMDGFRIVDVLSNHFPTKTFAIENDAKCAAIAEYTFGKHTGFTSFALITLGTGVGCGAIFDGQLFKGGRGNPTELGHIPLSTGKKLELELGHNHISSYAKSMISKYPNTRLTSNNTNPKTIAELALGGDELAIHVYERVGNLLGEGLIYLLRLLDVNDIMLGGGISGSADLFMPNVMKILSENLPPYYVKDLKVHTAKLKNDAGILGAASLVRN